MKSRNLFTGIILLFIGVVALLAACNVFEFSWTLLWRLWPMMLILIGGLDKSHPVGPYLVRQCPLVSL